MRWNRVLAVLAGCLVLSTASAVLAEVSLTDRQMLVQRHRAKASGSKTRRNGQVAPLATGSVALIDASGLKWFFDTNITFSTTSSASGSASEASYTQSVQATTVAGAIVAQTMNDAFDGYNTLCVSLTGAAGPCATGNAAYAIYNQNRQPAALECGGRQLVFPEKTIGPLSVSRKVFVPTNDSFGRWMNVFTNTSGASVTFNMIVANNLGSDSNTQIISSSNGNATAETSDTWVTTFQRFTSETVGTTSSDPRMGHVLRGVGGAVGLAGTFFANGNDHPYWSYTITLAPGETKAILNFAAPQPTKALANAKSAELAGLPPNAQQCLTPQELARVVNFVASPDLAITDSDGVGVYMPGQALVHTIVASNVGTVPVIGATVVDAFPADLLNVSWTCAPSAESACGAASGTGNISTTADLLAGGSATFTVAATASLGALGSITNTATITPPSGVDANPANNTASDTDVRRGGAYYTIAPCRLADTRDVSAPALNANVPRTFPVTGHCLIPPAATAVELNMTVAQPTDSGHLSVFPTGSANPGVSAANYVAGQSRADNGVYPLGAGGQIDVSAAQATGTVQVILDVTGYFIQ